MSSHIILAQMERRDNPGSDKGVSISLPLPISKDFLLVLAKDADRLKWNLIEEAYTTFVQYCYVVTVMIHLLAVKTIVRISEI